MGLALWLLPVAITCCLERATGQLARHDTNTWYQNLSRVNRALWSRRRSLLDVHPRARCNRYDGRQMCTVVDECLLLLLLLLLLQLRLKT